MPFKVENITRVPQEINVKQRKRKEEIAKSEEGGGFI